MSRVSDRFFDYEGNAVREAGVEFAFLADRPAADWAAIVERGETRLYRTGETIVGVGEVDQALLLLLAGRVGIVLPGESSPFKEIEAPSVVGEVAFFDGGPRSVTLVALTECELLRLSRQGFDVLAARDPALGRAILSDLGRILAARLRMATDLMRETGQ